MGEFQSESKEKDTNISLKSIVLARSLVSTHKQNEFQETNFVDSIDCLIVQHC